MTENVVSLPKKPALMWVCGCGCATFELHGDGLARCALCMEVAEAEREGSGWFEGSLPEMAASFEGDSPMRDLHGNGSLEFARRLAAKRASYDDAIVNITVRSCGTIYAWSGAETEEQYAWVQEQLTTAKALLDRKVKG